MNTEENELDPIKLIEVCNTWQGEGPDCGRQMLLVRFKHCNLACSYCDTMIKMKQSAEGSYTIDELNKFILKTKGIMITGGEPTFEPNYTSTIKMLKYLDYQIANIETNGNQIIRLLSDVSKIQNFNPSKRIKIIYSPKVFNQNSLVNELGKISDIISDPKVFLKIVPTTESIPLIEQVSSMIKDRSKIYLMPLGSNLEEIAENWVTTIDLADKYNLNITPRMHISYNFV